MNKYDDEDAFVGCLIALGEFAGGLAAFAGSVIIAALIVKWILF